MLDLQREVLMRLVRALESERTKNQLILKSIHLQKSQKLAVFRHPTQGNSDPKSMDFLSPIK